ncbi:MAG TPA: hypothetical protein VEC36_13530, partial [Patescibacteria group bacterium]|nr:hypothetical protein [Patescibacteria group bacterium]
SANSVTQLRKLFKSATDEGIRRALILAEGTLHAEKLQKARLHWLYTRALTEQATAPIISQHHAAAFKSCKHVLEICTGAGSDTAEIAIVAQKVTTIEADAFTAEIAQHNFLKAALENIEVKAGLAEEVLLQENYKKFDGLWADPARRESGTRFKNSVDYLPSLDFIMNLPIRGIFGIKISPGVNVELPKGWTREWVGFKDECREQILWKNSDRCDGIVTLFEPDFSWKPRFKTDSAEILLKDFSAEILRGKFIVEPHAALIRSGFLSSFFKEEEIQLLDEKIAYGISFKKPEDSPLLKSFEIIDVIDFSMKRLQKAILELGWNKRTEIKKRGLDTTSDEIFKKLKFTKSGESGVVIITRVGDEHTAFLCKRVVF